MDELFFICKSKIMVSFQTHKGLSVIDFWAFI